MDAAYRVKVGCFFNEREDVYDANDLFLGSA